MCRWAQAPGMLLGLDQSEAVGSRTDRGYQSEDQSEACPHVWVPGLTVNTGVLAGGCLEGCGYHNSHGRSQEARVQVRTGSRGHQPDGAGTAAPLGEPAHRTGAGQQASAQGRRLLTGLVSNAPQGTGVRKRYPWDGGIVPRGDCPFPGVPRQSPLPQSGCEPLKQENAPRNLGRSREARSPGVAAKPQVCSLGKGWGEGEQVNIWESQHPSPIAGRRGSCLGSLGAACPPRLPPPLASIPSCL